MNIYLGASGAINPLGNSVSSIFDAMKSGQTGIAKLPNAFDLGKEEFLGIIDEKLLPKGESSKIYRMLDSSIQQTLEGLEDTSILKSPRTRLIICSTKGDIDELEKANPSGANLTRLGEHIQRKLQMENEPLIVSSACISGLLGVINGARMIQQNLADHVLVAGADLVTKFTLSGFISFYATATGVSKPYDADRDGINLGEAAASTILSKDPSIFKKVEAEYLGGASANDANHISGPSRTGEGLYRSVKNALVDANLSAKTVDYISAHGTATSFNDEMESIAFDRHGMNEVPLNSFKGYFGHTLGAAGLLESLIGIESLQKDTLLKSYGFEKQGTSKNINVLSANKEGSFNTMLKTASGFGGSNAAGIFKKP
ncbi:beta-ketoacyl synthase N-terminal-like domain-containing protein [Owenweeksia hongkongensis]|uniref:beta-ketoacyl synthase N-terminal-like domain-containing protein n=1 Tax=Owenweeksia hongkongensis TaxID=253245 RepID=UPI003A94696F